MQIEIEKLKLEITLCFERLGRKDADIRKLIIQLEELKEWQLKFEEIKRTTALEIARIRSEWERRLSVLQIEYERLKKEHSVCPSRINALDIEILRLLKIIEDLQRRPKSQSSSSARESVSEEENLEIVQVLHVSAEDRQFEVIEERKEVKSFTQVNEVKKEVKSLTNK